MEYGDNDAHFAWFVRVATGALVVAILRLGEDVLLPIAFAGLLAFLLSPLVVRLTRFGLPKTAAIIATVTLAFAILGAVAWVVSTQAIGLVRELPNYEQNLHQKIATLKQPHRPVFISRIATMVENLERDLETPAPGHATPPPPVPGEVPPVPVEVKPTTPSPWEVAGEIATPVLRPLGVAGIVIVFVVAMLFQREDLRDRVIKLVSAGQLNVATQALDDAASRVSRYLGMQLVVNATYGVPIGVGLYLVGIPNALLWGLMATLLRFIPFLGPWIAAAFPVTLAIAADPGWTMVLYVLGIFVLMEIISANIVEVLVYGAMTGISNLALLIAAVFWTWLWGPAGLVLSTPLTVCLLVLGKYVPGLSFLRMLLGTDPVLEPPAQFYERMLSMESEDMLDLALRHIAQNSLEAFYDDVFLPALLLAEEDRHRGALPELRQQFIFKASRELIEELERADETITEKGIRASIRAKLVTEPTPPRLLILPARNEADEIVALVFCHLMRRRHIAAAPQALAAPTQSTLSVLDRHQIEVIVISALPPSAVGAARQLSRRLREVHPDLPIIVGVWRYRNTASDLTERLRSASPQQVVTTLAEAIAAIEKCLPPSLVNSSASPEDLPSDPAETQPATPAAPP